MASSIFTETIDWQKTRIEHVREKADELEGEGQRLGTAYRLRSGEIVYVPEPQC